MSVKIIAVGDPHFQVDNIPEVTMFIDKLEELAKRIQPDRIVILGDVLHTHERLHTTPLNKAYEFVARMREIAPTIILVGNHDMVSNQQYLTDNHWMNGLKEWRNVTVIDRVQHLDLQGYHFVFCPYVYNSRFIEALNSQERNWRDADCIFAHQEFAGCKMGAIISVEGDKWPLDYPEVVSGHIHSRQTPQSNIYYCGSSMQHAFGESDQNIIPILTWGQKGHKYSLQEIDLGLPRKKIIYTDVKELDTLELPENCPDKIKITVNGSVDEFKAFRKSKKFRQLTKAGAKVTFKSTKLEKARQAKAHQELVQVQEGNLTDILLELVKKDQDVYLEQVYELVVNDRQINEDDIFFLPANK